MNHRSGFATTAFSKLMVSIVLLSTMLDLSMAQSQDSAASGNTELAELLASARRYQLRMTSPDAVLTLREPPLLNFTNPERNQERGSVFVWLQDGRPAAIGQFFRFNVNDRRLTKHRFHFWRLTATDSDRSVWDVEYDPSMSGNTFANPATLQKVYNSYHP